MTIRTKLLLNLVAILLAVAAAAYSHTAINRIAATFIEVRVADAKFFSQLVRDNWDGIKTVPDEKKKILLQNLDPSLAGTDLRLMRDLVLIFFYCIIVLFVVGRVDASLRLWKSLRRGTSAP